MPFHRRQEALSQIGVEEKFLQVKNERLLHEDVVVFGNAEGVVIGRLQFVFAWDFGHHLGLIQ